MNSTNVQNRSRVHQFDVFGVLAKADIFGKRLQDAYRELRTGLDSQETESVVANYQAVLDGKLIGTGKKPACDALEVPIADAYTQGRISVPLEGIMYEDALAVLEQIVRSGELYAVLTTGSATPLVPGMLNTADTTLATYCAGVFSGDKLNPETFRNVAAQIRGTQICGKVISHTEDAVVVFEPMQAAQLGIRGVYVDRTGKSVTLPPGVVSTPDLRHIAYASL